MTSEVIQASPAIRARADVDARGLGIADRSGAPVIRATGLSKRYGSRVAVSDVTFDVEAGEVFGFLGPNGSGKSTTIAMLLGLVTPTSGQVGLFGLGPERRFEALGRVGAIIESPAFYPYLSGFDNLSVLGAFRGGVPSARIREVLHLVGLAEAGNKRFGAYSLGMKQRLGIAWTLIHDPELIILDEPTNGLDPAGVLEVRHVIRRLADLGKAVLLSSHVLHEVEQVCDRVAILRRGRVVAQGRVADLVQGSRRYAILAEPRAQAEHVLRALVGVEQVEERDGEFVVTAPTTQPAALRAALVGAGIKVAGLRRVENRLEDVFLELTSEGEGA